MYVFPWGHLQNVMASRINWIASISIVFHHGVPANLRAVPVYIQLLLLNPVLIGLTNISIN